MTEAHLADLQVLGSQPVADQPAMNDSAMAPLRMVA
jgi:hypothetical protein